MAVRDKNNTYKRTNFKVKFSSAKEQAIILLFLFFTHDEFGEGIISNYTRAWCVYSI